MSTNDRRGFLSALVGLPLLGGGVKLIGKPTAVAGTPTREDLLSYADWLFYERRILCYELCNYNSAKSQELQSYYGWQTAPEFHFPNGRNWREVPQPSTRAALVMSAVGYSWRGE